TTTLVAETTSTTAWGLRDLCGGVTQRGADLIDLHFHHRAPLTVAGFEGALHEAALHDDAHALGHRLSSVLRRLTPCRTAHEQGLAVLPLTCLAVEGAWCG